MHRVLFALSLTYLEEGLSGVYLIRNNVFPWKINKNIEAMVAVQMDLVCISGEYMQMWREVLCPPCPIIPIMTGLELLKIGNTAKSWR